MAMNEDIRFFADEQEQRELSTSRRGASSTSAGATTSRAYGHRFGVLHKCSGARSSARRGASSHRASGSGARRRAGAEPSACDRTATVDFVPYVGSTSHPVQLRILSGERVIGGLKRKFELRHKYVLDLTGDPERSIDRRLAIALAVGLDTLQNRLGRDSGYRRCVICRSGSP